MWVPLQAYHAGILGTLLYQSANEMLPAYNVTVAELIQDIANLQNEVDGVPDAQGIVTSSSGQEQANLVRPLLPEPATCCVSLLHRMVGAESSQLLPVQACSAQLPVDMSICVCAAQVPVNSNAMLLGRTPLQVLSLVTMGSANGAGGFYPQGLYGFYAPSSTKSQGT